MEDRKLIIAVCLRPVLYNTMMVLYRDRNKKERAWVDVAEDTGFPDQPSSESEDAAPAPAPAPAPVPAAGPSCVPVPEAGPAPRTQSAILQALQSCANPTPLSGIEHYVLGLVPSLVRMPPEVLEYVKFQISKVIFDNSNFTLNLEPV
ncbi:unnamed protein product [Boreogadus saida]